MDRLVLNDQRTSTLASISFLGRVTNFLGADIVKYAITCKRPRSMLHEGNISPTNTTRGEIRAPTGSHPNSPPMLLAALMPGQCMLRWKNSLVFGPAFVWWRMDGGYAWLCFFFYPVSLARGRSVSVLSDVTYRAAIYEGRSINIYRGK